MSTTWRQSAGEIATSALQLIGAVGAEETPEAFDLATALAALNGLLKELPAYGLAWPKLGSGEAAIAWNVGVPAAVTLPADYAGNPALFHQRDGNRLPLPLIPKAARDALTDPSKTAQYPESAYIDPLGTVWLYPVPTTDPQISIQYQRVIDDATAAANPDIQQMWTLALGYGVAVEIAPKYGVPLAISQDLERKWIDRRERLLAYSIEAAPIVFTVDD